MAELDLEWEANKQEDEQFAASEVDYAKAGYETPITKWERNFFEAGYRRGVKVALKLSEAERDAALSTVAKVEALHHPFEWSFGFGPVTSCRWCADHGVSEADAEYPCPTIRALGSVPSTNNKEETK